MRVPEPLLLCTDTAVTGAPFFLMRRVGGSANPVRLTRGEALGEGAREALVRSLGEQLARVHAIPLDERRLSFLPAAGDVPDTLGLRVAIFRRLLLELGARRPVLDWTLEDVLPHLPAERRYPALMIANAMGIASRELERADVIDVNAARSRPAGEQVPRIDGSTDLLDAILLAQLREDVRRRLAIVDPKRLRPARRSFATGEGVGSRADSESER